MSKVRRNKGGTPVLVTTPKEFCRAFEAGRPMEGPAWIAEHFGFPAADENVGSEEDVIAAQTDPYMLLGEES